MSNAPITTVSPLKRDCGAEVSIFAPSLAVSFCCCVHIVPVRVKM